LILGEILIGSKFLMGLQDGGFSDVSLMISSVFTTFTGRHVRAAAYDRQ
jgi:hypothetical protein